ncbi:MAG TPA: ABC transporter ATP-binding protein [Burkholderiales bacterium]|jgi:branched-chain amino acid transport system ATP-binding protein|nr:ABC transporter ATP-binding protein [Burkholderiales bacterium]
MLEARDLSAGYGRARILFGLDLAIDRGEVVALLGRNGAGKSTTLKALMGLIETRSGEVRFEGAHIERHAPHEIARLGLGYVPEDRRIFTDLTVAENLEVGRQPARTGAPTWGTEKLLALFPALGAMLKRRGGSMSGGEQQMLCIARTLAGNPKAILLDEPSEGLAPVIVDQVAAAILEMKWAGVAVLLAEQSARFTERVADRGYKLEKGKISPA